MNRNYSFFNGKVVLLIVVILVFSLCASPQKKLNLVMKNSGQQFEIFKNTDITIELKTYPATGYEWTISEMDTSILTRLNNLSFDPESKKLGAPVIQTLHFKAIKTGETRLKLIYHRPWEKDKEPIDSFIVFFNIKE